MRFSWNDVLDGLDEGLDIAKKVAAIVPGGQEVALGLTALDAVVETVNKDTNDNKIHNKIEKYSTPIDTSLTIIDAIVESKTKGVNINNDDILNYLETFAKSTGNNVDDQLVCIVKAYLECDKK